MKVQISLLPIITGVLAQHPPQPEDVNIQGTTILDHDHPIEGFYGQTFLKQNIPYIDIPDSNIQDVYYYRWSALQRHLRYINPGTGYMMTEFMQSVGYAQAFGSIDAAAGHQIDEARWLRSRFYNDDYISLYARGPGNSSQYTQWIIDAAYRRSLMNGDTDFTASQLSSYIRMWHLWDYTFDESPGLYYFTPEWDAQEFSLPGYVSPNPVTHPDDPEYGGPDTYRPSLNAYMFANAHAIKEIAGQVGDRSSEDKFTNLKSNLERAIYGHIWNNTQQFFVDIIKPNNPDFIGIDGREEVGYYPYRFGLGLSASYSNPAIAQLFDTQGFYAPYGPTTLEQRNQYFSRTKPNPSYCCFWQGQSWPYSTSHTLKSMAEMYRSNQTNITADNYYEYLSIFATTQHKNGQPYVAESHYPYNDSWSADSTNHSENYDHSTYCDDVITGLLGVVPQTDNSFLLSPIIPQNWSYFAIENLPYKSHLISVFYDASKSSNRYNQSCTSCLTIYVDGSVTFEQSQISFPPYAHISLPDSNPDFQRMEMPINIVSNPVGISNPLTYPRATASYTYRTDSPWKANDGTIFYDAVPDNRWSNYESPNTNDTLSITFPRPREFNSVTLAIYSDVDRQGSVDVPSKIEIYGDSETGLIITVEEGFIANDRNTFSFNTTVSSTEINVLFVPKDGKSVGVCELEVWVPPPTPAANATYHAVDAYVDGGVVVPTTKDNATSDRPYVTDLSEDSTIMFSGVVLQDKAAKQGATLTVLYANTGSHEVTVHLNVNAIDVGELSLTPNESSTTKMATVQIDIERGKNFVTLLGGSDGIRIFGVQVS